jgi:hypothetical protein
MKSLLQKLSTHIHASQKKKKKTYMCCPDDGIAAVFKVFFFLPAFFLNKDLTSAIFLNEVFFLVDYFRQKPHFVALRQNFEPSDHVLKCRDSKV